MHQSLHHCASFHSSPGPLSLALCRIPRAQPCNAADTVPPVAAEAAGRAPPALPLLDRSETARAAYVWMLHPLGF